MMRLKGRIYATFKPRFVIIEISRKGGISSMMTQDNEKIRKQMQIVCIDDLVPQDHLL